MLGKHVHSSVLVPMGTKNETGYTTPLNFAKLDKSNNYAFIMGIDHPVINFDGRVIAALVPKNRKETIYVLAPKNTRFINTDILKFINLHEDFPGYKLQCLYERSAGAVIYRTIRNEIRYLLIKNKRSAHWGFPKGHIEKGESNLEAAKREVLEETGLHIDINEGFETLSHYKIRNRIDKQVHIFVGTTDDYQTLIQKEEIQDYIWLTYDKALSFLRYDNDKKILVDAHKFLMKNKYI